MHEPENPTVTKILERLESDILDHPERLRPFPVELLARITAVTEDVEVDHEAPIDGVTAL